MPKLNADPRELNRFELLARLDSLNWLSANQLRQLGTAMVVCEVGRHELIFDDRESMSDVFILLSGAAKLVCVGVKHGCITVALIPPGVIAQPPRLSHLHGHFRCEALGHSRVGKVSRDAFVEVALGVRVPDFERLAKLLLFTGESLLTHYPGFLGLGLRARVAVALLDLGAAFGARNTRGVVLTITPTQQDLADLVGASRPKVSVVLGEFARRQAVYREGRRIALNASRLEEMASASICSAATA